MVAARQVKTGGHHSLMRSIREPSKGLVGDLKLIKVFIDRPYVDDQAMAKIALGYHESTQAVLGTLNKIIDGPNVQILIAYSNPL